MTRIDIPTSKDAVDTFLESDTGQKKLIIRSTMDELFLECVQNDDPGNTDWIEPLKFFIWESKLNIFIEEDLLALNDKVSVLAKKNMHFDQKPEWLEEKRAETIEKRKAEASLKAPPLKRIKIEDCLITQMGEIDAKKSIQTFLFNLSNPETHLSPQTILELKNDINKIKYYPLLVIVPAGLSIRLPLNFCKNGMDEVLFQALKKEGIEFFVHEIESLQGTLYTKEILIPTNKDRFLNKKRDEKIENSMEKFAEIFGLNQETQLFERFAASCSYFKDFEIYHSISKEDNLPRSANTIGLTLASLYPPTKIELDALIKTGEKQPERKIKTPLIEFDFRGLLISIPEGLQDLNDIIRSIAMVEETIVSFIKYGKTFTSQFLIPQAEIPAFLHRLDMRRIPSKKDVPDEYASYESDLTALNNRFYRYEPKIIQNDPYRSIVESLKMMLPNPKNEPSNIDISLQKNGDLVLRILHNSRKEYKDSLPLLLGIKHIDLQNGDRLIVIPLNQLKSFIKKLKIGEEFYDQLLKYNPFKNFTIINVTGPEIIKISPKGQETKQEIRILTTISKTLASFDERAKKSNLRPWIEVKQNQGLDIWIPKEINDFQVELMPNVKLPYGVFLQKIFSIEGEACNVIKGGASYAYHLFIPEDQIQQFIEEKLGLDEMPKSSQFPEGKQINKKLKENIITYFNEFVIAYEDQFQKLKWKPHASVKETGISLMRPSLVMPENIILLTLDEILQKAKPYLKEYSAPSITAAIKDTFALAMAPLNNPHSIDSPAKQQIRTFMSLIANLFDDPKIDAIKKENALVRIGEDCAKVCLEGRGEKLYIEWRQLQTPPGMDETACIILQEIEQRKMDLLTQTFQISDKIKEDDQSHYIAAAALLWKNCGLDPELGKLSETANKWVANNDKRLQTVIEKKDLFEKTYNETAWLQVLFDVLKSKLDQNGSFSYAQAFEERLKAIFSRRGLTPEEIETKIRNDLLPLNEETYTISLTEKALEIILIDMGILNP